MTVCIDVGCARYGGDYSIERLIEEFKPEIVFGFDPSAEGPYDWDNTPAGQEIDGCEVYVRPWAAATYEGEIGFHTGGLGGHVKAGEPLVPCVDLADVVDSVADEYGDVILKIDAEGSEYDLLEHLIRTGADKRLRLAWVEWHPSHDPRGERKRWIAENLSCELHEWRW